MVQRAGCLSPLVRPWTSQGLGFPWPLQCCLCDKTNDRPDREARPAPGTHNPTQRSQKHEFAPESDKSVAVGWGDRVARAEVAAFVAAGHTPSVRESKERPLARPRRQSLQGCTTLPYPTLKTRVRT